jgi:hypothetical protein
VIEVKSGRPEAGILVFQSFGPLPPIAVVCNLAADVALNGLEIHAARASGKVASPWPRSFRGNRRPNLRERLPLTIFTTRETACSGFKLTSSRMWSGEMLVSRRWYCSRSQTSWETSVSVWHTGSWTKRLLAEWDLSRVEV